MVGAEAGADAAVEDALDGAENAVLGLGDLGLRVGLGFGFFGGVWGDGGVDMGLVNSWGARISSWWGWRSGRGGLLTEGFVEVVGSGGVALELGGLVGARGRGDGGVVPFADAEEGEGQLGVCGNALEDGVAEGEVLFPLGVVADGG